MLIAASTPATDQGATIKSKKNSQVPTTALFLIAGSAINIVENGHLVSRRSDVIIYSVEAEYIEQVVKTYASCITLRFFSSAKDSDKIWRHRQWSNVMQSP